MLDCSSYLYLRVINKPHTARLNAYWAARNIQRIKYKKYVMSFWITFSSIGCCNPLGKLIQCSTRQQCSRMGILAFHTRFSRVFHPCLLVPRFPLPRFPPPSFLMLPRFPLPRFQLPPKLMSFLKESINLVFVDYFGSQPKYTFVGRPLRGIEFWIGVR